MSFSKMTIHADTRVYGIFGDPVHYSLSPMIHNALFHDLGINAIYTAFHVKKESLGLAFEAIRALEIPGVNITIPHKEAAAHFVDEIPEDLDRCVGALNTVVNRNGKLFGYNTDGKGFLTALHEELSFDPEGKTALVIGAGGAARGVVFALAQAHAEKILVYNRTWERAEGLGAYLEKHFPETEIQIPRSLGAFQKENPALVVNATSCGMRETDPLPIDLASLSGSPSVYDLVYTPAETKFIKLARKMNFPCAGGLGMLAAQAAFSFELWTGKKEGVRDKMLEVLKTCRR